MGNLTQTHTGFVAYHSHFRNTKILPSGNLSVCEVLAELKKHSCIIQHPSSRYSELPRWVSQSLGQSAKGQVRINPHWFCRATFCKYKILTYNELSACDVSDKLKKLFWFHYPSSRWSNRPMKGRREPPYRFCRAVFWKYKIINLRLVDYWRAKF